MLQEHKTASIIMLDPLFDESNPIHLFSCQCFWQHQSKRTYVPCRVVCHRLARALKLEILLKLLCKVLKTRKMVTQTSLDAFNQGLKARDTAQTALLST